MTALTYGSVCSGIEAASVAWHPLGMQPAWFAEIAAFPSAVLGHRWPAVPNFGDFTRIGHEITAEPIDVLVGGTPCQSFSDAGGRAGLDDPRGVLALEFLRLAARLRARWLVWENVRGVFSADDGAAFATIVGLLVKLGYGVAWRMLDLQFFGAPQRRRRVFVVGYLGDWRPPCAVLLERPSMRRDPLARGASGTSVAIPAGISAETSGVAHTITAHHGRNSGEDVFAIHATQDPIVSVNHTPAISAEPTGSCAVFAFDQAQITHPENRSRVAFGEPVPSIAKASRSTVAGPELIPRRLTPLEVERCFGFPDNYTLVPGASDSARYEALGNSMGVPVMAWIGRRLQQVDAIRAAMEADRG